MHIFTHMSLNYAVAILTISLPLLLIVTKPEAESRTL